MSVTEILPSLNGLLYEKIEDDKSTWVAYAMKRNPGKTISPKVWDSVFIQNCGGLIGKLHRVTQGYPKWEYCVNLNTSKEYLTWKSEWESFHQMCKEPAVKHAWKEIRENLRSLPIQRDSFGFIHNDPHLWNILVEGEKLTLIDFDVANHHWFINDVAIACQHVLSTLSGRLSQPVHHRDRLVDFLKEFLKGYEHENDLPKEWLVHLDLFFAYRRILLYIVMGGWRRSKPGL
jgi:Ser/Thr protein kinase RdoA (MazF antagonist)